MVWNSANSSKYLSVRVFAQKKKLALMLVHDSIIAARVKQTRDANRKHQLVPFKEGDFVYLSTKNITFAMGLARKLIPKYMGPYKITQDFKNQLFKIELPIHLKKRGVHDVFHSSLLRIHVPNDDRLFPGRMDTQIGDGPDTEDEWAIDLIQSHAESGEDSIFKIKWKSGDVTWLPYYQIRHLQALDAYLDLLGVKNAAELPLGRGSPPREDPQIFLGAMSLCSSSPNQIFNPNRPSLSFFKVSSNQQFMLPLLSSLFLYILVDFWKISPSPLLYIASFHHGTLTAVFVLPFNLADPPPDMSYLPGIQHPRFLRLSKTEYAIDNPGAQHWYVHVGQIKNYLAFDKTIREGNNISNFPGIPLGYIDFAITFNTGTLPNDRRRVSTYLPSSTGDHVIASDYPIYLEDFHITPEQCGLPVRGRSASSDVSSNISPSPLYIPPHRRQSKTECTRDSDTKVR